MEIDIDEKIAKVEHNDEFDYDFNFFIYFDSII
jgi:hypothetical protein